VKVDISKRAQRASDRIDARWAMYGVYAASADGSLAFLAIDPLSLLYRLAATSPRRASTPSATPVYFASASKWRPLIVPKPATTADHDHAHAAAPDSCGDGVGTGAGGSAGTGGTASCTPPVPGSHRTNPLFTDQYTADPAPFVDGCTFYINCGHASSYK
jgi:hypothetical protein